MFVYLETLAVFPPKDAIVSMIGAAFEDKCYILPIGGIYITYHPLREPETAIELVSSPTHE